MSKDLAASVAPSGEIPAFVMAYVEREEKLLNPSMSAAQKAALPDSATKGIASQQMLAMQEYLEALLENPDLDREPGSSTHLLASINGSRVFNEYGKPGVIRQALKEGSTTPKKSTSDKGDALFREYFPKLYSLIGSAESDQAEKSYPSLMVEAAQKAYADFGLARKELTADQLEKNVCAWLARLFSISLLCAEAMVEAYNAKHKPKKLEDKFKEYYPDERGSSKTAVTSLINTFMVGGIAPLAADSVPSEGVMSAAFRSYIQRTIGKVVNAAESLTLPKGFVGEYWQYVISLLAKISSGQPLSTEEKSLAGTLKEQLKMSPEALGMLFPRPVTDSETGVTSFSDAYSFLNFTASFFNDEEYRRMVENITDYAGLFELLGLAKPETTQQAFYAKTVAALYWNFGENEQKSMLAKVPAEAKAAVYAAICRMASLDKVPSPQLKAQVYEAIAKSAPANDPGAQALVTQLLKSAVKDYLTYKGASPKAEGNLVEQFKGLGSSQKAERNIAAAYQVLALLEALDAYNKNSRVDEKNKVQAYNAVMALISDLQKQAEIRGYRSAVGQSSYFAQILKFTSVPQLPTKNNSIINLPEDFLANCKQIAAANTKANRWALIKRSGNWVRQNPWAFSLYTLGSVVAALALGVLVLSLTAAPLATLTLPFIGSISLASLAIPAATVLGGTLLGMVMAGFINSSTLTAAAKIENAGLGKLTKGALQQPIPSSVEASSAGSRRLSLSVAPPVRGGVTGLSAGSPTTALSTGPYARAGSSDGNSSDADSPAAAGHPDRLDISHGRSGELSGEKRSVEEPATPISPVGGPGRS